MKLVATEYRVSHPDHPRVHPLKTQNGTQKTTGYRYRAYDPAAHLQYLLKYDNPWVNAAWILVMVAVADLATINRSELRR